jgi:hypothetical protein
MVALRASRRFRSLAVPPAPTSDSAVWPPSRLARVRVAGATDVRVRQGVRSGFLTAPFASTRSTLAGHDGESLGAQPPCRLLCRPLEEAAARRGGCAGARAGDGRSLGLDAGERVPVPGPLSERFDARYGCLQSLPDYGKRAAGNGAAGLFVSAGESSVPGPTGKAFQRPSGGSPHHLQTARMVPFTRRL